MSPVQELDLEALVGRSADEAQAAVTAAGGTLRTVSAGEAMTMEYRADRVTLLIEGGQVVRNLGIG